MKFIFFTGVIHKGLLAIQTDEMVVIKLAQTDIFNQHGKVGIELQHNRTPLLAEIKIIEAAVTEIADVNFVVAEGEIENRIEAGFIFGEDKNITPGIAVKMVVADVAPEFVIAFAAFQRVVAGITVECIIIRFPKQGVIAVAT